MWIKVTKIFLIELQAYQYQCSNTNPFTRVYFPPLMCPVFILAPQPPGSVVLISVLADFFAFFAGCVHQGYTQQCWGQGRNIWFQGSKTETPISKATSYAIYIYKHIYIIHILYIIIYNIIIYIYNLGGGNWSDSDTSSSAHGLWLLHWLFLSVLWWEGKHGMGLALFLFPFSLRQHFAWFTGLC